MKDVVDAAVEKAYGGARQIHWMEVYAGEKSTRDLRPRRLAARARRSRRVREYVVAIKGPMTTPVGGGIRSLNVALRQELDLYVCLRPVRWFRGVPSPLKDPSKIDMVIFRENTEDIYAGIEWEAESDGARKADRVPAGRDGRAQDPLPRDLRDRDQAGLARGHGAARPARDPVRDRATAASRSRSCTRATS